MHTAPKRVNLVGRRGPYTLR